MLGSHNSGPQVLVLTLESTSLCALAAGPQPWGLLQDAGVTAPPWRMLASLPFLFEPSPRSGLVLSSTCCFPSPGRAASWMEDSSLFSFSLASVLKSLKNTARGKLVKAPE